MCHKKSSQDSLRPKFDMSDNGKELLYTHVMNENGTYTECDRECRLKPSSEPSSSAEHTITAAFNDHFHHPKILLKLFREALQLQLRTLSRKNALNQVLASDQL